MQELLLLLFLFFLYNQLKNGPENPVELEAPSGSQGSVYISNIYFQRVVRTSEDGQVRVDERVGGGLDVCEVRSISFSLLPSGLNEEKWVFTEEGKIQNVGNGMFLRSV